MKTLAPPQFVQIEAVVSSIPLSRSRFAVPVAGTKAQQHARAAELFRNKFNLSSNVHVDTFTVVAQVSV